MPNRTPAQLEAQILMETSRNPVVSYIRLAEEMNLEGISVTTSMIRYVWERRVLSTRLARIKWAKKQLTVPTE
jgi:hypothetical protein